LLANGLGGFRTGVQVVAFADALQSPSGAPLVRAARVSGTLAPPRELPDLVVSTPAGLMGVTREFGDSCGFEWTRDAIVSRSAMSALKGGAYTPGAREGVCGIVNRLWGLERQRSWVGESGT
jgi:hypothetical protein